MSDLDPTALSHLYRWIDTIPLDRPKKNIARDFSDGVLMSQVIHYFFPKIVELHNYSTSNSLDQKNYNWKTLNQKVFKKMGFMISPVDIDAVVQCKKHAIERILLLIQTKIGEYQQTVANDIPPPPPAVPAPQQQPAPVAAAAPPRKSGVPRQGNSPVRGKAAAAAGANVAASVPSSHSVGVGGLPSAGRLAGGSSDKDATIHDLRETVDILQLKVQKLEQLLRLKNDKITSLQTKLAQATGQAP